MPATEVGGFPVSKFPGWGGCRLPLRKSDRQGCVGRQVHPEGEWESQIMMFSSWRIANPAHVWLAGYSGKGPQGFSLCF